MNAARRGSAGNPSSTPDVSVFLPTAFRFRDGHLKRAVDSLLAQDFDRWELLAVDDGSTDGTAAYLADLAARDPRIRHVRLDRNIGLPAFTLSLAWKHARAARLAWLFDDCEWTPDHLSVLGAALDSDQECGLVYGKARAELAEGRHFIIGAPFDISRAATGFNTIPNVCVMLRRSVIDVVGWYDPHVLMKRICDWDLWIRVARSFLVKFIDQVLAIEHGTSLPQSLGRMHSLDMALVLAYANTRRDHRLRPGHLVEADCYRTDLGFPLKAAQAANLDRLLLEHALFTANDELAEQMSRRMASARAITSVQGQTTMADGKRDLTAAMTELLRSRALAFAEREIELDRAIRAALEAADGRMAEVSVLREEISKLRGACAEFRDAADTRMVVIERSSRELAIAQAAVDQFRGAADQRLAVIDQLREQLDGAQSAAIEFRDVADDRMNKLEELGRQLVEARETAGRFRVAADERSDTIGSLQAALDEQASATAEFRAAADQRLDLVRALQQQMAEAEARLAGLRDELGHVTAELSEAERRIEQRDRDSEALRERMERMAEELDAARFRIDEARDVRRSLAGRFAYWFHRTLGN